MPNYDQRSFTPDNGKYSQTKNYCYDYGNYNDGYYEKNSYGFPNNQFVQSQQYNQDIYKGNNQSGYDYYNQQYSYNQNNSEPNYDQTCNIEINPENVNLDDNHADYPNEPNFQANFPNF